MVDIGIETKAPVITVIGDVIVDRYLAGAVSRISPEAPVPVLLHRGESVVPGGAANVAANAAALGAKVHLVGLVGVDEEAQTLRKILNQYTMLDGNGLVSDKTRPTTTKMRVVSGRQQLIRIDRETIGSASLESEQEIIGQSKRALVQSQILVFSDYGKGVVSDRVIVEVIQAALDEGVPVLVDPKRRNFQAYRGATLLKPNLQELEAATGLPVQTDDDVCAAAEKASAQFGGDVLVTRSQRGMTLWRKEQGAMHFPTEALEVADVSGAGDTSLAALAVWLANGHPLPEAVKVANTAAGIAVSRLGTAVVTRDDLEKAFLKEASKVFDRGRLVSLSEALEVIAFWRREGYRIVFTNGCFDLIHPGHIDILDKASTHGDRLIVALNSDASVRRLKGISRPVQDEQARARIMGSMRMVDLVMLFDEDTPMEIIRSIKPDVLVKGADYTEDQVVGADYVKSYGGNVQLIPLVPNRSTTALVQRMRA